MSNNYRICRNNWLRLWLTMVAIGLSVCEARFAIAQMSQEKSRDLYALVVGVGDYQDSEVPRLSRAARDAKDFSEFLRNTKDCFGQTHLTLLTDRQATRAQVAKALRDGLHEARKDDFVIVYMSGHGVPHPTLPNEYYFLTHDAALSNLFGTALLMNDKNLFKGVESDHVLLIADACYSGGFAPGLDDAVAKAAPRFLSVFDNVVGRLAISSSRSNELSFEKSIYGNSIFTHFLLKGLRGEASPDPDGNISAKGLYTYVYENTKKATNGRQNPQFYCAKDQRENTPVFMIPKYAKPLDINGQFFYEDEDKSVKPLTEDSILKSGQRVGIAFQPDDDCNVYIFWQDSSGAMGLLFPNPELTEGSGRIKGGQTYWLPSKAGKERWYLLDENPGIETLYFVGSRTANEKLVELCKELATMPSSPVDGSPRVIPERTTAAAAPGPSVGLKSENDPGAERKPAEPGRASKPDKITAEKRKELDISSGKPRREITGRKAREAAIERELNLMGFARYTAAKGSGPAQTQPASFPNRETLFETIQNRLSVSGGERVYKLQFKHVAR